MKIVAGEGKKRNFVRFGGGAVRVGALWVAWWELECHNSGTASAQASLAKFVYARLGLAKVCLAKLGFGQTWFWPTLVVAKLCLVKVGVGQPSFGQTW